MPTKFSKCDECHYLKCLPLDHMINDDYKNLLEIESTLIKKGIPREICIKIIRINHPLKKCTFCNRNKLCPSHFERAKYYANYYRKDLSGAMCDSCCWFEVS